MNEDEEYSLRLTSLLFKLKVAGLQRRSISIASTMIANGNKGPSRMCVQFSVLSLSLDYAVTVPYAQRHPNLDFY